MSKLKEEAEVLSTIGDILSRNVEDRQSSIRNRAWGDEVIRAQVERDSEALEKVQATQKAVAEKAKYYAAAAEHEKTLTDRARRCDSCTDKMTRANERTTKFKETPISFDLKCLNCDYREPIFAGDVTKEAHANDLGRDVKVIND